MIVFINHIFIYAIYEGEKMNHLWIVLQVLEDHQLYAKIIKYDICVKFVAFLIHIVSTKDIKVDLRTRVRSWFGLYL